MLAYIAQSTIAYAPLTQQQLPKAHRRKSSLSEARASLSPYGHPLARPPVHGGVSHFAQFATAPIYSGAKEGQPQKKRPSLQTKFERTNSATSSHFPDDDVSQPSSAIFAQFTRDTPPTPPPVLMELPSMSPFKMSTGYSPQKGEVMEKRPRVDSEVRRQKLGWGKRANSDGPAKVVAAMEPVPRIPLAFKKTNSSNINSNRPFVDNAPIVVKNNPFVNPTVQRKAVRQTDRENAKPYVPPPPNDIELMRRNASPTKKRVAKRPSRRAARMMSSVPTLRA
jgi:hypothetical protein